MKAIRTTLTFTFDPTAISQAEIKDLLDACLKTTFPDLPVDVHTRWVTQLSDAPLFGAAKREAQSIQ